MHCLTLQQVVNILITELLDNFKSVCYSNLPLKGIRFVPAHIVCIWWYFVVTLKVFLGHCWKKHRPWRMCSVDFGVRFLGFILKVFGTVLLSSEDSWSWQINIISFVLHIRLISWNYARVENRKFVNFSLSSFPWFSHTESVDVLHEALPISLDRSSLIFTGVNTFLNSCCINN
jgi:hypothetical protein